MAVPFDASNNLADISFGNFHRCSKIITTGQILPKWELKWYRGDHQISKKQRNAYSHLSC